MIPGVDLLRQSGVASTCVNNPGGTGTAMRYPKLSSGFFRWHRFLVEPFALAVTMLLNTTSAKAIRGIRVVSLFIPGSRPVLTVPTEVPHALSR
jgi:hypothetical protein